jgi:TRAP-type C4-dicarboxylate transport system substrate-binding protein
MNKTSKQSKDNTSKNQTISKWLTNKDSIDFDLKYWKTLAKERQKALEKALEENEELVHENDCLKRENEHLSQLAEEGIRLKNLLQEYID